MSRHRIPGSTWDKLTDERRAELMAVATRNIARYQENSLEHAVNGKQRWEEEEDLFLLTTELSLADAAIELGRTFYACATRHAKLLELIRHGRSPEYQELIADLIVATKPQRILCACGADIGDEHEGWCPSAEA
jgi:hypothetical protein